MSGLRGFLKRHRMMIIVPSVLAAEYYVWWKIQQDDRFVPPEDRKEIFIRPLEYAKKLYAGSKSDSHNAGEKSV